MINKNGLGFVSSMQAPKSINVTSFGAPTPIGIQKTYILPRAVEGILIRADSSYFVVSNGY